MQNGQKNMLKMISLTLLISISFTSCNPPTEIVRSPSAVEGQATGWKHEKFNNTSCVECHEIHRPAGISPSQPHGEGADCLNCHSPLTNSFGVKSWTNVTSFNHNPMPLSCIECHSDKRPTTIPHQMGQAGGGTADCVTCHSYPDWKATAYDHSDKPTSCKECHGTGINDHRPEPKLEHPSANYNQLDCVSCHTYSGQNAWADLKFDHNTHSPAPTSCMNCHETKRPAEHKTTPTVVGMETGDCILCHGSTNNWGDNITAFDHDVQKPTSCVACHRSATNDDRPEPKNEHPSKVGNYNTLDCASCHSYASTPTSPKAWNKTIFNPATHMPSPTSCTQCHKNGTVDSRPVTLTHNLGPRKNLDCAECHTFDSIKKWKDFTTFTHAKVTNVSCETCHNASTPSLTYKNTTHVQTTLACSTCHTSTAWKPASFKHDPSYTDCMSCHNGTTATGKKVGHIATNSQCSTCHSQTGWKPASSGKPANHFITTLPNSQDCQHCHAANTWTITNFTTNFQHSSAGGYPGDHNAQTAPKTNCTKCHETNSDVVKYENSTYKGTCASCHAAEGIRRHGSISNKLDCARCLDHNVSAREW